jgi:hypothetical protein
MSWFQNHPATHSFVIPLGKKVSQTARTIFVGIEQRKPSGSPPFGQLRSLNLLHSPVRHSAEDQPVRKPLVKSMIAAMSVLLAKFQNTPDVRSTTGRDPESREELQGTSRHGTAQGIEQRETEVMVEGGGVAMRQQEERSRAGPFEYEQAQPVVRPSEQGEEGKGDSG